MTTSFSNFSMDCQVFEPRGAPQINTSQVQQPQYEGSNFCNNNSQANSNIGFSDYLQVPSFQPTLNKSSSSNTPCHASHSNVQPACYNAQPTLVHSNSSRGLFVPSEFNQIHQGNSQNYTGFLPQHQNMTPEMPAYKMNFNQGQIPQPAFNRRATFAHSATYEMPVDNKLMRRQFAQNKNVYSSMTLMGHDMPVHKGQFAYEASSPTHTRSTNASSQGSMYSSEDEGFDAEMCGFESPSLTHKLSCGHRSKNFKVEGTWKKKVKTELCRFWLQGKQCENSQKDQGCGFAHGQDELMKKKGLSKQYLTSVCKNFLEHPSKCTYGQRCIFQHPTHDVRTRQSYTKMMQDNTRYTAMRLFQDIEGSETIYINTYAATAPRLQAFKNICNSAKDNGEDYVDAEDEEVETISANFSRDLFRSNSQ